MYHISIYNITPNLAKRFETDRDILAELDKDLIESDLAPSDPNIFKL